MRANRGPVVVRDGIPRAVAVLAVADEHVLAVDPLEGRSQRIERAARALVHRVRLELDTTAAPASRMRGAAAGTSPRRSRRCSRRRDEATSSRSRRIRALAGARGTASSRRPPRDALSRTGSPFRPPLPQAPARRRRATPPVSAAAPHLASSRCVDRAMRARALPRARTEAARGGRCALRASVPPTRPRRSRVHSARADLRVRMHGVRVALRGARPLERPGRDVPRVRRGEGPQAALELRRARRRVEARLQRPVRWRRRMLRRLVRLRLERGKPRPYSGPESHPGDAVD